jgi:hypothetical protein
VSHIRTFVSFLSELLLGRERLRSLRENIATRRRTISAAKLLPSPLLDHSSSREAQELDSLSGTLARARSGLVQELVEVFNVVEVGGRPPVGGRAGTKGEWTIGDLILPVPGDIRRASCYSLLTLMTNTSAFQATLQIISMRLLHIRYISWVY